MKPYQIEAIRKAYPPGTRIKLLRMEDVHSVPSGTIGSVEYVDAIGNIHMSWDNGRTLSLCPEIDRFQRIIVIQAKRPQMSTPER